MLIIFYALYALTKGYYEDLEYKYMMAKVKSLMEICFGLMFSCYIGFQHSCICYKQHRENKNKNCYCNGKREAMVTFESIP